MENAARAVLAAREPHLPPRGMSTLADLYDPLSMPAELARAHATLDRVAGTEIGDLIRAEIPVSTDGVPASPNPPPPAPPATPTP